MAVIHTMASNYSPILGKLNDDCLNKVFQFLHLGDLCNTAEVCKIFKKNADGVFKSHYTNLNILKLIKGNNDYHHEWFLVRWLSEKFLKSVEQLFRNFGTFIEAIHLTGTGENGEGMDENELLTLVKHYCTSLKELTLHDIGKDDEFSTELRPLFTGLEKLNVFNVFGCDLSNSFMAIFSDCHDLKHLNVDGVSATLWMTHKFASLESLCISNNWEFDYNEFESFLKSHENLRTLRYSDTYIVSQIFAMMSKNLLMLETFFCDTGVMDDYDDEGEQVEENILQLAKIKSLRNLTFSCEESSLKLLVDAFEKESTPIEYFEIFECKIDRQLIVCLKKIKSLKILMLSRCEIAEEAIIDLDKNLNRLDEIIIKDIKGFDLDKHKNKLLLAKNVTVVKSPKNLVRKRKYQDQCSADIVNILNDDCLVKIFEFVSLRDLCNVADVCQQFQRNAQIVFKSHHTCIKTDKIIKTDDNGLYRTDMQMAEQLFRNFGFFVQELSINGHYIYNDNEKETIMYLATKYCISFVFRKLTLNRITMECPMRWLLPLLDLFYHLPKLELHSCRLDENFGKFLSICKISTIQVYSPHGSSEWMNHTFYYLQILILLDILWQPETMLDEFIKLNGHLHSLVIHNSYLSSQIFKTVADHIPGLRGFCFAGRKARDRKYRKKVMHLTRLKSLTNLTLDCQFFSVKLLIDDFIKEATPISEFNIRFGTVDIELIEKLANLKSLKDLQLFRVKMNKVSLIDLVQKLPQLDVLDIDIEGIDVKEIKKMLPYAANLTKLKIGSDRSNVQIEINDYKSLLNVVKSREKANRLCITITSECQKVFVPRYLLQDLAQN